MCNGTEQRLSECDRTASIRGCSHSMDAGARCSKYTQVHALSAPIFEAETWKSFNAQFLLSVPTHTICCGFQNVFTTACLHNTITYSVDTSVGSMYCSGSFVPIYCCKYRIISASYTKETQNKCTSHVVPVSFEAVSVLHFSFLLILVSTLTTWLHHWYCVKARPEGYSWYHLDSQPCCLDNSSCLHTASNILLQLMCLPGAVALTMQTFGTNESLSFTLTNLVCTGSEGNLFDCSHPEIGVASSCFHEANSAGLICGTTCQ